jgi:hypothetical protein
MACAIAAKSKYQSSNMLLVRSFDLNNAVKRIQMYKPLTAHLITFRTDISEIKNNAGVSNQCHFVQ